MAKKLTVVQVLPALESGGVDDTGQRFHDVWGALTE